MDFLIFFIIAILVMKLVSYFGKKILKPLVVIRGKIKYEIISAIIIVLIGTIVSVTFGIDENPYLFGCVLGIIEGIVESSIVFEN